MISTEEYLVDLLKEAGLVDDVQVEAADKQRHRGESVVDRLIKLKYISEGSVAQTLAMNAGMDYEDLTNYHVPPNVKLAVPEEVVRRYRIAPLAIEHNRLRVAVSDPLNFETMDTLHHSLPYDMEFVCASKGDIDGLIAQVYGGADEFAARLEKQLGITSGASTTGAGGTTETAEGEGPIIKMVMQMLLEAFKNKASDIHIEPMEKDMRVRYRIDGVMHDIDHHPKKLHSSIIARLKIMSGTMSIDEKRMPQDGRISINLGDKQIDLRVSSVPTNHGESIVMRILDKSGLSLGLADLGFLSDDQEEFEKLITLPDGIILVTGPTGSGKTTTLYACLHFINRPDRKIITVEDPVEYELPGINQVMVKEDIGMTFAAALRAMLRQAPNIIMLGEIRDLETASIAINASLTGHLVFSTLHTNDAPSAVARLSDIGIKPFLIASSVRAVQAQRLVRKLCAVCKQPAMLSDKEMRSLRIDNNQMSAASIMGPVGCDKCRGSGYKGRMSLLEIFKIDDEVRRLIGERLSTPALRRRARELGMRTMREDGIRKVLVGYTTAQEVMEATMGDAE